MSLTKVSYSMIQGTPLNVLDFGAVGDGITDDTAAIEAAIAASRATYVVDPDTQMTWSGTQASVFFPEGTYVYNGTGITQSAGDINLTAIKNTATIKITSDVYFLTVSGYVQNTFVSGLIFQGGKGAVKYTNTGINVSGYHIFEDCSFDGYTECAVGNNSSDMPFFKFNRCLFMGDVAGGTIGIAIGGYLDSASIENCDFLRNKYHLKIGPKISGNVNILGCGFIAWTPNLREADIWFVPNSTDAFGVNSGFGTTIERCKFGNENMVSTDHRILVALENTSIGTDRLNHPHSTTWNDTDAYFSGLTIRKNRITGVGDMTSSPIIRSYINNINTLRFLDNDLDGGTYEVLCEFMGSVSDDEGYVNKNWTIELPEPVTATRSSFNYGISTNANSHGITFDDHGSLQHADEALLTHNSLSDDAGYSLLANYIGYADLTTFAGGTQVAVNDIYGTARASQVTVTGALTSGIGGGLTGAAWNSGQIGWLEFDFKKASSNSVEFIQVEIFNYSTNKTAIKRVLALPVNWRTARIPFILPETTSTGTWQVRFKAYDYTAGTATSFAVGRVYVYIARQPVNGNRISTIGDGTWNGEHLVMGVYHLWVSSTGKLYIKGGIPTSETDGTVVGTQT